MILSSKDNRYIRLFQDLGKKKYRRQYGLFAAEGKRVIEDFLASGLTPHLLLYDDSFADIAFLERVAIAADHAFAVESRLFAKIAATEHSQGIAVAFPCPCPSFADYTPGENAFLLILNEVQDPGNLGAVLRAAAAAEVDAVLLEQGSVDLFNPKVVRATMGALARFPVFYDLPYDEIDAFLNANGFEVYLADLKAAVPYDEMPISGKIAVVLGNEGNGISPLWRGEQRRAVTIPMGNAVESLNLAQAAAVIAFDRRRRLGKKG